MIRLSTGLRNALVGASGFAEAFANGVIEIRTGPQPSTADAAATGTLLGTITLNGGAFTPGTSTNGLTFGSPSGGTVSKSGVWSMAGVAVGTAGWARFKANAVDDGTLSTTAVRLDGNVGISGADFNLSNISITVGAPVTVDVFTWTQPA